jgi:pimeloyl-ACP methyl ester carboxylesterase
MRCWVQDSRTTIRQMAGCLADFVATRRLRTPVIAGHSLGAMVAVQFALDYPDLLRALVLINAGPPEGVPLGRLDIGRKVLWDGMRRRVMRAALDRAGIATRHPLADALLDDAVATDPAVYAAFSRAVARWNVQGRLRELAAPTLLIWGEQDLLMPLRIGERWHGLIPHSQLVRLPGVGHSPPIEAPEEVVAHLVAFMESLDTDGAGPWAQRFGRQLAGWLGKEA